MNMEVEGRRKIGRSRRRWRDFQIDIREKGITGEEYFDR